MNGAVKIITILLILLPLLGVTACSPVETIERDSRLKFRNAPPDTPIRPTDEREILIVPEAVPVSSSTVDKMINMPVGGSHFGLQEIAGSSLLPSCPSEVQNVHRKGLCIKIPYEPSDRIWWYDQYIKQLVSLGWRKKFSTKLPVQTQLTVKRETQCGSEIVFLRSSIVVVLIYDGVLRDFQIM